MKREERAYKGEYSSFLEKAERVGRQVEALRQKARDVSLEKQEMRGEIKDCRAIEEHFQTSEHLRTRAQETRVQHEQRLRELEESMKVIEKEARGMIADIGYLRQQDAQWEGYVRNEKENGPFPEA